MKLKSWRDMLPLAQEIYRRHAAGCCWHITLDDGNCDDVSVQFCANEAKRKSCEPCMALAPLMKAASRTQRGRLMIARELRT